jgi:hypothetical protein
MWQFAVIYCEMVRSTKGLSRYSYVFISPSALNSLSRTCRVKCWESIKTGPYWRINDNEMGPFLQIGRRINSNSPTKRTLCAATPHARKPT